MANWIGECSKKFTGNINFLRKETFGEEMLECVIQMWPDSRQRVIFIGISDLTEHDVFQLKCSRKHHALLEVNVVVKCAMHKHVRLVVGPEVFNVFHQLSALVIVVIVVHGWQAHVTFGVDRVIEGPVGD